MDTDRVYIPQLLQQPEKTLTLEIEDHLPDLETLTPVRAEIQITHQSTFLTVKGWAETIVTLTCHRCLKHYNHRVAIAPEELIWLQANPDPATLPLEREVAMEDLTETLPPTGYFDPATWIYEQICLALPQRQLCDSDCPGIDAPEDNTAGQSAAPLDQRWSILAQLQRQIQPESSSEEGV
ncbi:metal-binding protein [Leptolyngbya sp. BL0902]|uniref:YceD family protein n=1 Tax=Leptolyngbya sp. BL0902 TaxID=1115757 RepID=UPI0018E6DBEF|nr:YceD family protein [Leptolyngbya sp. BL0902]QQE63697.1 metal-binding protein [Leptolyngbya sp. BL0902]